MTMLFDAMPTEGLPAPDLRIAFNYLLSLNDLLSTVGHNGRGLTAHEAKWRKLGMEHAAAQAELAGHKVTQGKILRSNRADPTKNSSWLKVWRVNPVLYQNRIMIVLRVWRMNAIGFDITNPYVKPILDGFRDAGLYPDDSVKHIVEFRFRFEGIDRSIQYTPEELEDRKRRIEKHKRAGKTGVPRQPTKVRAWFDFYKLN